MSREVSVESYRVGSGLETGTVCGRDWESWRIAPSRSLWPRKGWPSGRQGAQLPLALHESCKTAFRSKVAKVAYKNKVGIYLQIGSRNAANRSGDNLGTYVGGIG